MKFEKGQKPHNYRENMVTCETCGKIFHRPKSLVLKKIYCSPECRITRVEHTCIVCGKIFKTKAYRKNVKYCSRSCLAKQHLPQFSDFRFKPTNKPQHKYHTVKVDGKNIRIHRYIMQQHLGRKLESWEHVHHIDGNHENNDISNLVVLSNSEHQKAEHVLRKK